MVSRYLVDGIVIAGLLTGVFGVLYLSQGLFGESGNVALRRGVPAIGLGLLLAIGDYSLTRLFPDFYSAPSTIYPSLFGFRSPIPVLPPVGLVWVEGLVLGILIGLVLTSVPYRPALAYVLQEVHIRPRHIRPRTLALAAGAFTSLSSALVLSFLYHADTNFTLLFIPLSAVSVFVGTYLALLAPTLSSRQLQVFGLTLTLVGSAAQFVPPVLDLLSIKVV